MRWGANRGIKEDPKRQGHLQIPVHRNLQRSVKGRDGLRDGGNARTVWEAPRTLSHVLGLGHVRVTRITRDDRAVHPSRAPALAATGYPLHEHC